MQAFIVHKTGDYGVLKLEKQDDPKPKKGEILIKQNAIGVNFLDICFRRGQYKINTMPATLGFEACGTVEAVGEGVVDYKPGDRVAYGTGPIGAYAEKRAINQHYVVPVPNELTDVQVAGCLSKGLMAHALLHRVYISVRAKKILIHAVAGGIGHITCQWAKYLGLEVFGTVGDDNKIPFAKNLGCDHVINYKTHNFVEEISKITNNGGVGLVYDGVGKDTLTKSLQCLWPMGMCVTYGEASGNTEHLDLNYLVANSLYITRPTLALHKANKIELGLSAGEVFAAVSKGIIKPQITTMPFKDAPKAHKAIEHREIKGSVVLTF